MSTAFKAVNGFTDAMEIDDLTEGSTANVYASVDQIANGIQEHALPCTIIPGHWASQIESGELLTEEEMQEIHNEWVLAGGVSWSVFLCRFIARKLRGEA